MNKAESLDGKSEEAKKENDFVDFMHFFKGRNDDIEHNLLQLMMS